MTIGKMIFMIVTLLALVIGFIVIGLLFYIGKTRVKEIDKAVLGYEFPHDSIFALIIRIPNYASGFIWKWSARRSGLEGKIEQFDSRFRWPFVASMVLVIVEMSLFIISYILMKYLGLGPT